MIHTKLLFKNALILDEKSAFNESRMDILIQKGKIEKIGKNLTTPEGYYEIISPNLHISQGWMDIGIQLCEPGLEHRETFESAIKAARIGGYTALAPMPNTEPVMQSKASLQVLKNVAETYQIDIHPIGAITKDCKGEELAEMYDMHHHGVSVYSDGLKSIAHNGVLLNALNYTKAFEGTIMHFAQDGYLSSGGHLHEGVISTAMGVKGIPSLAEQIGLHRDFMLQTYSDSRLCIYGISSKEGIKFVQDNKKHIQACVVPYLNLIKTDDDVQGYVSELKVMPPLRAKSDQKRLIKGLNDGTITAIASNHYPLDEETKKLEFTFAKFGASGIETAFSGLNTYLQGKVELSIIISALTYGPRSIFNIKTYPIAVGNLVNITCFDPDIVYQFNKTKSKSLNNPLLGQKLIGRAIGTVSRGKWFEAL